MKRLRNIVASGRALAALVLGISLVKVLWLRAFNALTGLSLFHQNYGPDRLPAVSESEREQLTTLSGCIACGRCDLGEAERIHASNGAYAGVMAFVLGASRSMPDYDAAVLAADFIEPASLREKERGCPTGVPIARLVRLVRQKAADAQT